ncbi:flagellar protein FlaG [Salsuginibacillus halophilus]|uniref:Flagellar protein FlaG n=1 Tax=Salsuginibacillus halophilus TaxID=517424 RepID=A0A2P8HQZ1_9BACI|nr:flagellar protein FlaG [Salsuginibacillus halophilus]PSL48604.1 flagellar protein FlaG [Salsuginibacillus halophilus]
MEMNVSESISLPSNQTTASKTKQQSAEEPPKQQDTMAAQIRETVREGKEQAVDREELQDKVDGMNGFLEANFTDLKFEMHDDLERTYVQVVERSSEEVVREVPPEKFLDMQAAMLENVGLLVDKSV